MAPSWSSRLLPGSSTNTKDKPSPRIPPPTTQGYFDPPPTLHGERALPSPPRPQTAGGSQHVHNRSVSHPLPKLFSRKKSAKDLRAFNDTDVPINSDDLVPVLDAAASPTPTRVISGKLLKPEDENKTPRTCMCCDSKLSVPKELEKFRCQVCLTINDLKPVAEQRDAKKAGQQQGAFPHGIKGPLSVERTKAIIDRCVITYLEAKCRRQEQPAPPPPPKADAAIESRIERATSEPTDTPSPNRAQPTVHGPGPPQAPASRKPLPSRPNRKPPPPPMTLANRTPSQSLHPNGALTPNGMPSPRPPHSPRPTPAELRERQQYERIKAIFRPLEDYMVAAFGDYETLNTAFSTTRPIMQGRTRSESSITKTTPQEPVMQPPKSPVDGFSEFDAKTLLLGDLGENSSWWVGKLDRMRSDKVSKRKQLGEGSKKAVSSRSPNMNWAEMTKWYDLVHSAGEDWRTKTDTIKPEQPAFSKASLGDSAEAQELDEDFEEARQHAIRTLFKVTENVLKRPTQPLKEPEHLRFLLIVLANPSLYPSSRKPLRAVSTASAMQPMRAYSGRHDGDGLASPKQLSPRKTPGREGGSQHTGILKRVLGLLANSSDTCHRYLIGWFARYDQDRFESLVALIASFVTHRISRRSGRPRSRSGLDAGGLIPDLSGSAANTSAQLHSAMGLSGSMKKRTNEPDGETDWANDWQVKAAAKVMSLLFAANNIWQGKRSDDDAPRVDSGVALDSSTPQAKAARSGQLMHTSQFYNLMLDYHDLLADFKVWETRRDKFAFCQYPLFLSMGAKIKILEYDARRQMEIKAREAYFDSVIRQRALDGYFNLRIRRDCMVDDSLRQISEAVGAGHEELKKGLRVHFEGEEGVDAGGPRKEWFLMLVRDIFDPNHGMFVYDDESHTCYFNPNSFETSDQYYLVGALLGLAIYNSTILDVALPPFAFRKLLSAAPSSATTGTVASITGTKGQMTYTVSDLAEFRPSLAAGLQQLLDFDGDVEATYCRDFVAPVERYGTLVNIPLIPNGEGTPVTNANRQEFVDAYIRYLLDTSVARQFEPFKRGFFTVCAGNALSLFRAEEIELLVRGSDEQLDIDALRAVAVYENWKDPHHPNHTPMAHPEDHEQVIRYFWNAFADAPPTKQRKLLTFITGTDRIPAVGATSLVLRIVAGGDGWGGGGKAEQQRFPIARTCFNMLVLWHYKDRAVLEQKLWRAVEESEGFGLK
ncbi:hypothetical protein BAUCODRAFT_62145 [Baudoinia panamericana UAMH 10762]|uniref:HECT-type E3 ubiquitin transferase n=1 Tax=Baudoinia panamericana (strain UAMH 10762) TaxID=717646 RepID=M2MUG7_BAUPA|nr:uncharacterized protein BAUCODRAFT_62145 [Baudoinia panamericana UAMH 10762]EMD00562.1 hypothetical protein BAUCODRAFT_62145 [Baudoinia panamericana UAMH 10762]